MQIPHTALSVGALEGVVLEFVTRDGTDHSPVDMRIASVMRQLDKGEVEIHFDPESKSCNIVRV